MTEIFTKRQLSLLDSRISQAYQTVRYVSPEPKKPQAVVKAEQTMKVWQEVVKLHFDTKLKETTAKHRAVLNSLEFCSSREEGLKAVEEFEAWAASFVKGR